MVPILRKHDQDRMCIYSQTLTRDSNSGGKQGVNPGAQQTRSGCPCPYPHLVRIPSITVYTATVWSFRKSPSYSIIPSNGFILRYYLFSGCRQIYTLRNLASCPYSVQILKQDTHRTCTALYTLEITWGRGVTVRK